VTGEAEISSMVPNSGFPQNRGRGFRAIKALHLLISGVRHQFLDIPGDKPFGYFGRSAVIGGGGGGKKPIAEGIDPAGEVLP